VAHPSARSWRGVAAACALFLALVAPLSVRAESRPVDRFDTIVLDAGHGGRDEGAKGPHGALEKHVVLEVARGLSEALRAEGLRVVMTRKEDAFVSLEQRTHIANDARGDLFLSIHANAAQDARIRGIETFFLSLDATDETAQRVAERENQAFGAAGVLPRAADDPLVAILGDLIATEHLQESQQFARMAQGRLARIDPPASRGVKQAPFVVLSGVQMPASLVEIGFITNLRDEGDLRSGGGRRAIVSALAAAVLEFARRHDALRGVEPVPAQGAR
jgi:N-acetylmuramoyl-L-alanine amidase